VPNVSIGQNLEAFVDAQVKEGRFQNASEVVRAGLRLLQERELEFAERAARLARGILRQFGRTRRPPTNPRRSAPASKPSIDARVGRPAGISAPASAWSS
jgi:putative addiction module CopG family antidote